jgi:hypothetical protein
MVYTDLHYFGALSYYSAINESDLVVFDTKVAFNKMSFKNRMVIASAQGPLHLSIPIIGGRDQKTPMDQIRISYDSQWQSQHFKSIYTNYKRAPFFEYYVDSIQKLYSFKYEFLNDYLLETQKWTNQYLKAKWIIKTVDSTIIEEDQTKWIDPIKPNNFHTENRSEQYQQVFEDVTGFIPNLCILDLIFSVGGKQAHSLIGQRNKK